MKIRTLKGRIRKLIHWYTEELTRELFGKVDLRTPSAIYVVENTLKQIQTRQISQEPQVQEWRFPLKAILVHLDGASVPSILISIDPEWEKDNLLYLDFDE